MSPSPALSVEVLHDFASFLALKGEWEEFRSRARRASVSLSHKWLRLSWETRWRRFPNRLRIVLVRENGRLVMAGAFVLHLFRGWPAVSFLDSGSPQRNDVLYVASDGTLAQSRLLLTALRQSLPWPMTLRARRLQDDCPLAAAAQALGWLSRTRSRVTAVTLDLTQFPTFADYLQSLSRKTREGHRRQLRRLAEFEDFSFGRETGEQGLVALEWLLDRKREWLDRKGLKGDWLQDRSYDRFLQLLLSGEDIPEFWVLTMRIGERIICAALCFAERETLNYSKITHDIEFDRLSPGFTTNVLMIREAYAAGFECINFGHGNYDTKSRLSKQTNEVLTHRIEMR